MKAAVQVIVTRSGVDEFKLVAQSGREIVRASVVSRMRAVEILAAELDRLEICPAAWSPECLRTTEI
ncbi:hypothetical protein Rpal_3051 [Rhodopseudomonas palustris TIE-1]|uniref:hypothetical protein n=1 Tax=Rhodopseudomonas palustris TaxID=1076 RepID=UPI0001779772|nr:hypothetical protein [Rhodopseudomonas palustris]ACF01557.1 hypothetical protein Rpal_3051 [Rhodopseudomonas palustris TIE-1]